MPLYDVAILEVTKKVNGEETEKLVFGPKSVIAKDDKSAAITAIINNKDELEDMSPENIKVLVRPFV